MFTTLDYHSESCMCESCDGALTVLIAEERLRNLAANLAIGAALCASFDLGLYNKMAGDVYPSVNWWPGCKVPAP